MRRILLALCALALLPVAAPAAEQTLLGKQLLVKNPGAPEKRKVLVKVAEGSTDNTLVGDPTSGGATVTISLYGGTASAQTFTLSAGLNAKGKPFWKGDATKGYSYKDANGENGAVKVAKLKVKKGTFQLKLVLSGKNAPIELTPPEGGIGGCVQLTIGGGDTYSIRFADGAVKQKADTLFKVKDPVTQGTCTIGCGNGFIDGAEQCDEGLSCGGSAVCQSDCTCPCDFLDTADCLFPYPSDYLTIADPTTDTGRRVHYAVDTMPRNTGDVPITPDDYNLNDGFSPGSSILLKVPGVDLAETGAVPITDLERAFDADQPVVVINADTLERHLIWAELDANATTDEARALILRPAKNFTEGARYIVALRNLKDAEGATIPAGADFAAYRDGTPTGDPVKEARRAHMEALFDTLTDAGIAREDLYLAWDFTVASTRNLTERLLFVRDDGFARLGSDAPAFTVTTVQDEVDANIFRIVDGTYTVERYVDAETAPARFVLDANGLPTHQGTQTALFRCIIPRAALANAAATAVPARASIYGHGLLGQHTEVGAGNVRNMANEHNFVFCATRWIGMSIEDVVNAVFTLQNMALFPNLTDRLQQAMLNQLFLARLMIHPQGFISDAAFQDSGGNPVIDTSDVFYDGNSQGGIFGATVMAIAQDITRGVLGVPGMNYSLLLTRSVDFDDYKPFFYPAYPSELQRPLILALIQMLWDRSDPNGYAAHIVNDPLPNTPSHEVLLHSAFGDHQVANVSTEIEARTIGIPVHQPALAPGRHTDVDPYFAIAPVPSYPHAGSALIIWDSGEPAPPIENIPPTAGSDPHSDPRNSVIGRQQKSDFLQTGGFVSDVCSGAPCVP